VNKLLQLGVLPLVLDPVVAGSKLTKVLINDGVGLNIIFASTLKKMGLDITDLLTPMDKRFYSILLDKAAIPLGQVTLLVMFSTKENYKTEYIKFEVDDFMSSYHAIFGRPSLTKFMAILHYMYLL